MSVCSGKGGVEALQHSHDVLALAYRPDGKLLASATLDGQIYLWDPQEAQLLVSLLTMSVDLSLQPALGVWTFVGLKRVQQGAQLSSVHQLCGSLFLLLHV